MGDRVTVLFRRERKEVPAIDEEIQAAEEEGVHFVFLAAPHRILGDAENLLQGTVLNNTVTVSGHADNAPGLKLPLNFTGRLSRSKAHCRTQFLRGANCVFVTAVSAVHPALIKISRGPSRLSLVAKSDHRLDFRRAPRRNPARQQCNCHNRRSDARENHGIVWAHAAQQAGHSVRQAKGHPEADDHP